MLTCKPSLKPHKRRIYRAAFRWKPNVVCIGIKNRKESQVKYWLARRGVVYYCIPEGFYTFRAYDPARAYEQWQRLGVKCHDSPSLVFEASSFVSLDSFMRTLDKTNSGN